MTKITKIVAREWVTLIGGLTAPFFSVPMLFYMFNPEWASKHSLIDFYNEFIQMLLGNTNKGEFWISIALILGPYCLYQFGRSISWSIRTMKAG